MKFGQAVARQWYHERISAPTLLPRLTQVTATTQRFVMAALKAGVRFYQVRDEDGADLLMFTFAGVTQVLQERDMQVGDPNQRLHELFPDLPSGDQGTIV